MVRVPRQPSIRLYVSRWCVQCERAAALLARHGLAFETIDVGDPERCCQLHELTGGASVPQVVIDGRSTGGYDEIAALLRDGTAPEGGSGVARIAVGPIPARTGS
jgi:glutaredoxin